MSSFHVFLIDVWFVGERSPPPLEAAGLRAPPGALQGPGPSAAAGAAGAAEDHGDLRGTEGARGAEGRGFAGAVLLGIPAFQARFGRFSRRSSRFLG